MGKSSNMGIAFFCPGNVRDGIRNIRTPVPVLLIDCDHPPERLVDAVGDAGQGAIIDLVGGVELGMIVGITEN